MGLNSFSNQVAEALVKLGRTSSETHQKKGFKPDTSAPVKTCLHLAERVSTVTPFKKKPMRVCDCLPGPEEWTHQIIQRHPLGQSCRCTWGCVHVQLLRTVFAPVQTCRYLTFPPSDSLFSLVSLLWLQFLFPTLSSSASLPLTEITPPSCSPTPILLLCRCHNLDDSLISNYLRPNFLELVCFSVDWEAN